MCAILLYSVLRVDLVRVGPLAAVENVGQGVPSENGTGSKSLTLKKK